MRKFSVVTGLLGVIFLAGCALGPDPSRRPSSAADDVKAYSQAPTKTTTLLLPVTEPWWYSLKDPTTTHWVDQALHDNPDALAAASRVLEADAAWRAARSPLFPQADLAVGRNRSKVSFVFPQSGRTGITSTTYSADLRLSYTLDLFGGLRRGNQAAWASLLAGKAERAAVALEVAAAVCRGRNETTALEDQARWAREERQAAEKIFSSTQKRYEAGVSSSGDYRSAKALLAGAVSEEALAQAQALQARHTLLILLGKTPESTLPTLPPLPDMTKWARVDPGLPASLLDRRPDLQAARWRFASATAGVGVAMADLFPKLSLTASGGRRSSVLHNLTSRGGLVYSAIASLVAPLFSGGRRRAAVQMARAKMEEAQHNYAGAVLRALKDVEDALVNDEASAAALSQAEIREHTSLRGQEEARKAYEMGLIDLARRLQTESTHRLSLKALSQARSQRWNARVALLVALGGSWDGRTPPPLSEKKEKTP